MSKLGLQVNKLLVKFKNGKTSAIDELFNISYIPLFFIATKYTNNRENAKDAISEAFVSVLKSINSFDTTKDGFNWLCKIVENEAKDIYSKEHKYEELKRDMPFNSNDFEHAELKCDVHKLIKNLEPDEWEIIFLKFYQDNTYDSIAQKLGITTAMAFNKTRKVLEKIRKKCNS